MDSSPAPSSPGGSPWVLRMLAEQFHRDVDGRPLREGRTPPEFQRPGEIEYKACPYPGSRQATGLPMNVSALRQTSATWDDLIGALGLLRTAYAEARGRFGPDLLDVWRVSQLGSALPWYFVLRGEPLPAYAAALSKATLGSGILAQRLLQKRLLEQWTPPVLTAAELGALAESTGTLVGETEVCAAPDRMIGKFLDALVAGEAGTTPALARLRDERDAVVSFGASYAAFKLALWVYYQARRFLYADICEAAPAQAAPFIELLEAGCEPPDFYVIEPPMLARVPPALRAAWLNQLAGLIEPFAPDGRDAALLGCARRFAAAMARTGDDAVARARATYDELDAIHGALIAAVEAGLRGSDLAGARADVPVELRDRLIMASPRAAFAALR